MAFVDNMRPVSFGDAFPDPDDDILLAVAQAAGADYLITGDINGLLNLKSHGNTQITTPRELVQMLR
jgi:predicted nucleic acid-binding protein